MDTERSFPRQVELLGRLLTCSVQMEWEVMCLLLHQLVSSTGPHHGSWPHGKPSVVSLPVVQHRGVRLQTLRAHSRPPVWGAADLVATGDLD